MDERAEAGGDGTAPISASFSAPSPAPTAPSPPVATAPPGWYALNGEQRYWDGMTWTEHRTPAAIPAYTPMYPPAYAPAYSGPVVVTDARTNSAEVVIAWILTVLTVGYMLPWAIAATRGKSNSWAVGLVNFFLGWTLIGWVVALVMACLAHQVVAVHHRY